MGLRKPVAALTAMFALGVSAQPLFAEPANMQPRPDFSKDWKLRDNNFYSNWNDVRKIRGNGTYVYASGVSVSEPEPFIVEAPTGGAKIIDVATQFDPCSYEHGVCVIRGNEY